MKRRIAILGATGSIGQQTLDVVRQHPDRFDVRLITANNNVEQLVRDAVEFDVPRVVICNEDKYPEAQEALMHSNIEVHAGMRSICGLVSSGDIDVVVASMVGFSGLRPTLAAIRAGKTIALANKETLVAAGSVVMAEARRHGVSILPVDSEHSAIFQCLLGAEGNPVRRLHLTASGGPFRTWDKDRIASATSSIRRQTASTSSSIRNRLSIRWLNSPTGPYWHRWAARICANRSSSRWPIRNAFR